MNYLRIDKKSLPIMIESFNWNEYDKKEVPGYPAFSINTVTKECYIQFSKHISDVARLNNTPSLQMGQMLSKLLRKMDPSTVDNIDKEKTFRLVQKCDIDWNNLWE